MDYKEIVLNRRLGEIIRCHYNLRQLRQPMYTLEDVYFNIPFLSFILWDPCDKKAINSICSALESYVGICKWCLYKEAMSRKDVYVISIKELNDYDSFTSQNKICISARAFFGETEYKLLCEKAVADMEALCEWVSSYLDSH